jgi:hypothetical protein
MTFNDLKFEFRGGRQERVKFNNGYGASIINDGYGWDKGLYEICVLGSDGRLNYKTPITDDVIGYLTEDDVTRVLGEIAALPAEAAA